MQHWIYHIWSWLNEGKLHALFRNSIFRIFSSRDIPTVTSLSTQPISQLSNFFLQNEGASINVRSSIIFSIIKIGATWINAVILKIWRYLMYVFPQIVFTFACWLNDYDESWMSNFYFIEELCASFITTFSKKDLIFPKNHSWRTAIHNFHRKLHFDRKNQLFFLFSRWFS